MRVNDVGEKRAAAIRLMAVRARSFLADRLPEGDLMMPANLLMPLSYAHNVTDDPYVLALFAAMDEAAGGGATFLMAFYALEMVLGEPTHVEHITRSPGGAPRA